MLSVMSKTNIEKSTATADLQDIAQKAGLYLMAAATVIGIAEITDRPEKVLPTLQPAYAFAGENEQMTGPNDAMRLRREREEEAGAHAVSYGISMRTPSRTGKQ